MFGGVWHTNQKSHEKKLLSHINLLTHIAISRTWTFTTTHQYFPNISENKKVDFGVFFVVSSFHSQNQSFRCLLRNEWRCWEEVYGIQIKKVKKHFTLSHNSVNSYCYFAHMDSHDHTPNIFQISQKTKKVDFGVFFVVSSFHSQNQSFRCLLRNQNGSVQGGVWHTNQKSHEKKKITLSHKSLNSYCYLAHMDFHNHPPNIFQISQKTKKSISVFFSSFRLFTAKISRFDVFYGMKMAVFGGVFGIQIKKVTKKNYSLT